MDRLALINDMLKESPNDPFLHYAAALEHRKAGNNTAAVEVLTTLNSTSPDYRPCYYQLGQLLEQTGQIDAAIEVYRAGKKVAQAQKEHKTAGEINEALVLLDADDEDW